MNNPNTMLLLALSPLFPPLLLIVLIQLLRTIEVQPPPPEWTHNAAYEERLEAERRDVGLIA